MNLTHKFTKEILMLKTILLTSLVLFKTASFAHEGEHGPSTVQAPKGGVMRTLETVHLELLSKGTAVQIFAYDLNLKPADVTKYPVSATITLPKKKSEALMLEPKGDHWLANFDAKGAHRYSLDLTIKQGGHDDKVKFTVEPKRK
jgi:hypothetical protein